jgi:hypothetical protein
MYEGDGFAGFENSLSAHVMKNDNAEFGREIFDEAMGSSMSKHLKRSCRLAGGGSGGSSSSSSSGGSGGDRELRLWEFIPEQPEGDDPVAALYANAHDMAFAYASLPVAFAEGGYAAA